MQIWINNGGDPNVAAQAAAVALAESSGDPNNTNHNTNGSWDMGLWQINRPSRDTSYFDVTKNTKAAISDYKSRGNTWKAWCTAYSDGACGTKNGSYSFANSPAGKIFNKFAGTKASGVLPAGTSSDLAGIASPFDPSTWLNGFLTLVGVTDLKDLMERLGFILLGAVLIFIGLHIMGFSPTKAGAGEAVSKAGKGKGGGAAKAVLAATPEGRAAEMAGAI